MCIRDRYYIGSDAKNYYQATDEAKLKGSESVMISVTCHEGVSLISGTTQYKWLLGGGVPVGGGGR